VPRFTEEDLEIRRREDGSIDVDHYSRIARVERSRAFTRALRRLGQLFRIARLRELAGRGWEIARGMREGADSQ
jgi:hypothetical protein